MGYPGLVDPFSCGSSGKSKCSGIYYGPQKSDHELMMGKFRWEKSQSVPFVMVMNFMVEVEVKGKRFRKLNRKRLRQWRALKKAAINKKKLQIKGIERLRHRKGSNPSRKLTVTFKATKTTICKKKCSQRRLTEYIFLRYFIYWWFFFFCYIKNIVIYIKYLRQPKWQKISFYVTTIISTYYIMLPLYVTTILLNVGISTGFFKTQNIELQVTLVCMAFILNIFSIIRFCHV